jgi:hypothetical protein
MGSSRLRIVEVLATLLAWWVVGPAIIAGPILLLVFLRLLIPGHGAVADIAALTVIIGGLIWLVAAAWGLSTLPRRWRGLP